MKYGLLHSTHFFFKNADGLVAHVDAMYADERPTVEELDESLEGAQVMIQNITGDDTYIPMDPKEAKQHVLDEQKAEENAGSFAEDETFADEDEEV